MLIDTLTAKLVADASDFVSGMVKATSEVQKLQTAMTPAQANFSAMAQRANAVSRELHATGGAATGASHGIATLRRGMEALAFSAVGVSGPVGRITSGLLWLGGGSALVLGVVAGIGLIAGAFKLATAEIAHFNKVTEDAIRGARDLLGSSHQVAIERRAAVQADLEDARRRLEIVQRPQFVAQRGGGGRVVPPDEATIIDARRAVAALEFELLQAEAAVARVETSMRAKTGGAASSAVVAVESLTSEVKKYTKATKDAILETERLQNILAQIPVPGMGTVGGPTPGKQGLGLPIGGFIQGFEGEKDVANLLNEKIVDPMSDTLSKGAFQAGQALVQGLIQGTASLGDVLKGFILSFVGNTILGVLGKALGIASPSRVAYGMGRNFSLGLAMGIAGGGPGVSAAAAGVAGRVSGSASLSLNVSGMPRAGNPLAAARDGDWQRFLRESNLVARGDGFRFA